MLSDPCFNSIDKNSKLLWNTDVKHPYQQLLKLQLIFYLLLRNKKKVNDKSMEMLTSISSIIWTDCSFICHSLRKEDTCLHQLSNTTLFMWDNEMINMWIHIFSWKGTSFRAFLVKLVKFSARFVEDCSYCKEYYSLFWNIESLLEIVIMKQYRKTSRRSFVQPKFSFINLSIVWWSLSLSILFLVFSFIFTITRQHKKKLTILISIRGRFLSAGPVVSLHIKFAPARKQSGIVNSIDPWYSIV